MDQHAQKNVVVVGFVALVFIAMFLLWYYRLGIVQEDNLFQQVNQLTIEDKNIAEDTKPFKVDIVYPSIKGEEGFNSEVEKVINEEVETFKKISLVNDEVFKETDPTGYQQDLREYDLNVSYTKGEIDGHVISIVLDIANYTGGAHGAHYFRSINYDPFQKKDIALSGLFPNQKDYLKKISDFARQDLAKQIKNSIGDFDVSWIDMGTEPTEENFSVFLIQKDSIIFYFLEYQVAPYAAGSFQVTMPR